MHEGDVLVGLDGLGEIANQRRVAGRVERNHQRAGETRAECLGSEVERLAFGAFLTEVAVIREAQLEGEHRRGEGDEQRSDTDGVPPCVTRHVPAPGLPARGDGRIDLPATTRADAVDPRTGEAQEGGKQGDGSGDHDEHDQRSRNAGGGQERHAGDGETENRDHDRATGENHGLTGGGGGAPHGFLHRHALGEVFTVAGDEEEGVIDADTDADHRHHLRRPRRDIDQIVDEPEGTRAQRKPEQCGTDRETHGDHRAEGDQQDDDGGDNADHLAGAGLGFLEHEEEFSVGFDPKPVGFVEFGTPFFEILEGDGGHLVARWVLDANERHGAIGRDLGVGHGDDIIEFSKLGSDLIDLREVIGDGFAGNDRRNHELCTDTGGIELGGFEQDERVIAVLTRDGEGVFEVTADRGVSDNHSRSQKKPQADDKPGTPSSEPAQSIEHRGHGGTPRGKDVRVMVRRRKAPKRRTTRRYVRPARSPPSRP